MTTYTVKTWNNLAVANAPTFAEASEIGRRHVAETGTMAKIRNNDLEEVLAVNPDGTFGKSWQADAPYTADDANRDALDAMEDA